MCLAVPMTVISRDGFSARCEARGVGRPVSLILMQHEEIQAGDHVMVHVGYAIQKITPEDAQSAWEIYDEMFATETGADEDA